MTRGMGMAERYRRWFAYEKDSHRKVLAAFAAAPRRVRATRQFRKAVELAGHIVAARQIWLFRLGVARRAPSEFFPTGLTLRELSRRFARMHAGWSAYLSSAREGEIRRSFEYVSTEGIRYRNSVEDVLTQLYGHSLYHRGQIGLLMRSAGAEPAETDFVFWTREPVISRKAEKRRQTRKSEKRRVT
jgi:uncharacterized damage-inducible protein DinB